MTILMPSVSGCNRLPIDTLCFYLHSSPGFLEIGEIRELHKDTKIESCLILNTEQLMASCLVMNTFHESIIMCRRRENLTVDHPM